VTLFLAFIGVAIVVIVVPGPDTAVTIRNTLLGGRTAGIFTALGIVSGTAIWAFATSVGIAALLVASEPLFLAVKYAGAAYLVLLGVQALREAFRPGVTTHAAATEGRPARRRLTSLAAFRQGLISNLGNPKMAIFFASLLPQFVPAGVATFSALLFLGAVFVVMGFVWLTLYAVVIAKAGDFLRRPLVRRMIEGVSGTVLIGLGIRIAAEQK
jgi:threonine/homoserine/homoserine lactone efflux protein